jgi:hypothetical protein
LFVGTVTNDKRHPDFFLLGKKRLALDKKV